MNKKQAIKMIEQQFEEAKRWQHILQDTQSDEDFKHATLGIHAMGIVIELAKKQVEELEVLSQEWIDEHLFSLGDKYPWKEAVPVVDLQKLLVPKQELPVIPKFVAEWYESEGKRSSWWNWFYKWGRDESRTELESKAIRWMQDFNEEAFVNMFLHGYEVEEEQKYIVRLPSSMQDSFPIVALGRTNKGNLSVRKNRVGINLTLHDKYLLTEQEIKDYDERYWSFAVKVKEEEE